MIRPSWLILARSLEGLALCLWLGGLIAVGALVAPVAFGVLSRPEAGRVVGECFRRLNLIGFACGGALLLALLLDAAVLRRAHVRLRAARAALVLAAIALGLYLGLRLFPEMNALRAAGSSPPFQRLHHLSAQLLSLQMLLLLGELICSAATVSIITARGEGRTLQHGGTEITEEHGEKMEKDVPLLKLFSVHLRDLPGARDDGRPPPRSLSAARLGTHGTPSGGEAAEGCRGSPVSALRLFSPSAEHRAPSPRVKRT